MNKGPGLDKVVVIGLDACDPSVAQALAKRGKMPVLAKLLEDGSRASVKNPHGLFVGALWPSFQTGMTVTHHRFYCWDKIDPQTYQYELVAPELEDYPNFWSRLSMAGKSVAVIDVPHSRGEQPVNGFEITEWGAHDKHFGFHTLPPELAQKVVSEFGHHPVFATDNPTLWREICPDDAAWRKGHLRTAEEDVALAHDLVKGTRLKSKLVNSFLDGSNHDLFLAVFDEAHAAGHQLWHMHDPKHPRHDPATVAAFGGDPIEIIYGEMDKAVGEVLDRIDPASTFMLLLSHGMGPHYDGTHLLAEILRRLQLDGDDQPREQEAAGGEVGHRGSYLARIARPHIPALKALARKLHLPTSLRRLGSRALTDWEEDVKRRANSKFYMQPNNTVYGGVRLNLVGREAHGCIDPAAADAEIAWLESELLQIRCEETGKQIIRAVQRSDQWHVRRPDDEIPDLLLDWDRSIQPTTVSSPAIGTFTLPYGDWRTGDHRPAGLLVVRSPDLPAGERLAQIEVQDMGPTIAAFLKTELPAVEGRIAPWAPQLARNRKRRAVPA